MGLFGSKTKTTVGTSVSRVIADENLPDAVLESMTRNLANDGEQMIEQFMEAASSSIGNRANRMYKYGKTKYVYGLPSGTVLSSFAGREASKAVLEQLSGGVISMAYYEFGPMNNLHIGWKRLTEEHGYDYLTNKIGALSTTEVPVYLKDMRVIVTNATLEEASNGSLDQWGTAPNAGMTPEKKYMNLEAGKAQGATSFAVDPSAPADYILVDTCWEVMEPINPGSTVMKPVIKFGSFQIALTGYDFTEDWHQVKYVDHNLLTHYWVYQVNTAQYPDLDKTFDTVYNDQGTIFPWVYFRYNKTSMAADKTSEAFLNSKRMLKTLNMDYEDIIDSIHESPDIDDVEQAMMVMAVPADTNNPMEQRYLFDFFTGLYEKFKDQDNAATQENSHTIRGLLDRALNRSTFVMEDKRFKMALTWKNIIRRKVAGKIGAKGAYKSGANVVPSMANVPSLDGGEVTWDTSTPRHFYQHQITENVYEEVQIFELKLTYYIFEQYTTTGDETDEILLIPIDIAISKSYSVTEREELYARGLHFVFNSRIVTKLKWYQTGLFKIIMVIISIIIIIFSYGSAWQTMGAALAAGTVTLTAVVIAFVQELVKYLIIQLVLKLFVKEFGAKFAFIVAIIAALYGTYTGYQAGSIAGAPWSNELLQLSSGLTKAANVQLKEDYQDLLGEYSDFQKFVKDQTKLLDETKDLLTNNERLAPLIIFGEKPQDFYQRTVHSGNIGPIGMDAIESYVDVALSLPKFTDTLT